METHPHSFLNILLIDPKAELNHRDRDDLTHKD